MKSLVSHADPVSYQSFGNAQTPSLITHPVSYQSFGNAQTPSLIRPRLLLGTSEYARTYPLEWWYFFEELLLCFNFNMTFAMIIQDFGGQIGAFICIFCLNITFDPPGTYVLNYPWGKGIYFEELLICFNFNMTFAMIIQDIRGQIGTFLSKYAYFAENATFDPPGCLCMTYPLEWWYFFRRTINKLQF